MVRTRMRQRRDHGRLKTNTFLSSPVIMTAADTTNAFIARDIGMMLAPQCRSTLYAMRFILGSIPAGCAALPIPAAVVCHILNLVGFFGTAPLKSMRIVITGFMLPCLNMFWAQSVVSWDGNLPHETGPLWAQMFGHCGPNLWMMKFCVFAYSIGTPRFAWVKRKWSSLLTVAGAGTIGVWMNSYLLVVPAIGHRHSPRSSAIELLLAGFLPGDRRLCKVFPVISGWEMRDAAGEEGPAY